MPVKGIKNINRKLDKLSEDITNTSLNKALYIAASVGAGYSVMMTPMDTSNLVNSIYIKVGKGINKSHVVVGYTANYAAAVHGKKGTLKGKPRSNGNGNYWDPAGEPHFLSKAFDDNLAEVYAAFNRAMKL